MTIPSPAPGGVGVYTGLDAFGRPSVVTTYQQGPTGATAWFNAWSFYQVMDQGDYGPMINRAIQAAANAGGGTVYLPTGTYNIATTIVLQANVHLLGDGITATTLKLANGANVDLINGGPANVALINVHAANNNNNPGGINNWSIKGLSLAGNRAFQSDTVANPAGALTTSNPQTTGGNLKGNTSYTFAYTYITPAGETLMSPTLAYTPPAGTNTNQVTLNAPALPAGATGTNWYLTASADGAAVVGYVGTSATNSLAVTTAPSSWTATIWAPPWNTTTQSYCLRIYGYCFTLFDVMIRGGYSGGALCDWNGTSLPNPDSMTSSLIRVKSHDNNRIGLIWGGPHDSRWYDVTCYNNTSHNFYIGPHSQGVLATSCHGSSGPTGTNTVCWLIEADGCIFTDCSFEGSDVAQAVILANNETLAAASFFGLVAFPSSAVQVGQQAGLTPYAYSNFQASGLTTAKAIINCNVSGTATVIGGTNGVIWCANETGGGLYVLSIWQTNENTVGGTPGATDTFCIASGAGGGAGQAGLLKSGGYLALGQSATAPVLATSGTIAVDPLGVSRVAPAAAVTGVILAVGTYAGQTVKVINESAAASTVTFAVAGTSHVADGVSSVIAGLTAATFTWDTGTSLWYRG